jgi:hypothetical protein
MFAQSAVDGKASEAADQAVQAGMPFHYSINFRCATSFLTASPCYVTRMGLTILFASA